MKQQSTELFTPAGVMPEQFFQALSNAVAGSGERRLMLAVLEDAVQSIQTYALARSPHRRLEFEDAKAWVMMDDEDWPFSFLNVCDVLGFDRDTIRTHLFSGAAGRRGPDIERAKPKILPLATRLARFDFDAEPELDQPGEEAA